MVILLCLKALTAQAQGSPTRYVYDDNGRLRAVIAPNGEANIYEYDPAGNITAIRRNTAAKLEVLDFYPREGAPGTQVTIIGTGFGGLNAVAFNGAAAQIVSVNVPLVVVTVPEGATSGPIGVTTAGGTVTTALPFTVRGIGVTPASAVVLSRREIQFTAAVVEPGAPNVVWSVNGIEGGSSTVGTISSAGLYVSPNLLATQAVAVFRVRATSVNDASVSGEAVVTVKNPEFLLPAFARAVSIQNGAPPASNMLSANIVSVAISIRDITPSADSNTFAANVNGGVGSIQNSLPSTVSNTFAAIVNGGDVSVQNGVQQSASNAFSANPFGGFCCDP